MEEPEALLKHIGLTEYEAKAILVVLKNGKSTADVISNLGKIPLPRVYDTMSGLADKGLIIISKTRPQSFSIIDPKRLFDSIKDEEKKRLEERIKIIDNTASQFLEIISSIPKPVKSEEEAIAYLKRRVNVGKVWEEIQSETKKEFLVFAGDLSWVNERAKEIKQTIRKKVKYRILSCKPIKEISKNVKLAIKLGVEVRFFKEDRKFRGFISDGEKVYLIDKILRDTTKKMEEGVHWSESVADYSGIIVNSKLIADIFRRYFYHLWDRAIPAEKQLKLLK